HARLYGDAMQRAQDLQHLLTLMQRLMNSKGSYQDILDQTLRSAVNALGRQAQMGSIYLYDRSSGLLTIRAHTGYPIAVRQEARFAPGKGLAGYVYKTGRLWNVRDTEHDPRYKRLSKTPDRVRSTIGVPLRGRSGVLGVLCLDNLKRPHAFTPESEKILTLFAGEVAPWLENARLVDMLRELHNTAIELLALDSPDIGALLEVVAERLLINFNLNGCAIGRRENSSTMHFVVKTGLADLPDTIEMDALPAPLQQDVLTAGQFVIIDLQRSLVAHEWTALFKRADLGTLIALPLHDDRGQHSLMLLASVGEFAPSGEELNLLLTFANQIALALENARLYGQVHGELLQKIKDLQQANRRLEMMREQEVQYRNARLATGLLHQINNTVANIPDLVAEIERQWVEGDAAPLHELKYNATAAGKISHLLHQFVQLGNLTLEQVDLAAVIAEAQRQLKEMRLDRDLDPVVHLPPQLPLIRADRVLLEILFQNLLRNAYEAIPPERPGQVAIEIEHQAGECCIRIRDNGRGIPPDQHTRIWEWGFSTKRPDSVT
ncbi:MAG: GAF domain-containing protein, partial [Chloroflexi bacterium]|nr:GAF domain-containing protein [Chloroflexota bacterium]